MAGYERIMPVIRGNRVTDDKTYEDWQRSEWEEAVGVRRVRKVLFPAEVEQLLETPGLAWQTRAALGCAIYTHALRV